MNIDDIDTDVIHNNNDADDISGDNVTKKDGGKEEEASPVIIPVAEPVVVENSLPTIFAATVPEGIRPGQTFKVSVKGTEYDVTCPANARSGQTIHVPIKPPTRNHTTANTTPVASSSGSNDAPPGVKAGGQWGTNNYIGPTTQGAACVGCLCFCLPGLLILCCPCDVRDAYKVDGKIYLADGTRLDGGGGFQPKRQVMARN